MAILEKLQTLRAIGGKPLTRGLPDAIITRFAQRDARLEQAVDDALGVVQCWRSAYPDLIKADESLQRDHLQAGFINFYADDAVNPYVAHADSASAMSLSLSPPMGIDCRASSSFSAIAISLP